jgi:hypothetical protein
MKFNLAKPLVVLSVLSSYAAIAQSRNAQRLPIYPFRPMETQELFNRVGRMAEERNIVRNLYDIEARGLSNKRATNQPWAGSYWPLVQGQIANTYHDTSPLDLFNVMDYFRWERGARKFQERRDNVLSRVYDLTEAELAEMAPSEKYDLLLGDTNFDLTNRIWNYVQIYGAQKYQAFLTDTIIPEGFRLPEVKDQIETWEGICHGWALAATGAPRPEKTVHFTLPNGRRMPIYPTDIKALVSLMYANSQVQNEVLMEGIRCNNMRPKRDEFGRYIDEVPRNGNANNVLPACADVHPAVWYLSVVNLTGVQGRSMVVEIDANGKVNNHPFAGYEARYFNPQTGRLSNRLDRVVVPRASYRNDPFVAARNPDAVSIVGVQMKMIYTDWMWPRGRATDSPADDKLKNRTMLFDLELDARGNVVGGQWRVTHVAEDFEAIDRQDQRRELTNQPDFFWVLPKNYQRHFVGNPSLPQWDLRRSPTPPTSWIDASKADHSNIFNFMPETCTVVNDTTGEIAQVPCVQRQPQPRPLINLVNKLLELSRQ